MELVDEFKVLLESELRKGFNQYLTGSFDSRVGCYLIIERPVYDLLKHYTEGRPEWSNLNAEVTELISELPSKTLLNKSYGFFKKRGWRIDELMSNLKKVNQDNFYEVFSKSGVELIINKLFDNVSYIVTGKGSVNNFSLE